MSNTSATIYDIFKNYPDENSLSRYDFEDYASYECKISPLFMVKFMVKTNPIGSCCLVEYDWDWDIEADNGCICEKKYDIYSLIVSVVNGNNINQSSPLDCSYQINFISCTNQNLSAFNSINSRDGSFTPQIFSVSKTMDDTGEHPYKNLLKSICKFESYAMQEAYVKSWFYTFEGTSSREKYYDAFINIVKSIVETNKSIDIEKKENPHFGRKKKN